MPVRDNEKSYFCPVEVTIDLIGGKWKSLILYYLIDRKVVRFGELRRLLPRVTAQMLSAQLRELEADGLISRKIYTQIPPKVEYRLTGFGETLAPVILAMTEWGKEYVKDSGKKIKLLKMEKSKS
ncbi:MAG TPA: helix-turn-helix domain-containing protein [Oculatellaceae cyanobacterium]